jgi:hypothetical protein
MLVGYLLVPPADDRQILDLQPDAQLAAGDRQCLHANEIGSSSRPVGLITTSC